MIKQRRRKIQFFEVTVKHEQNENYNNIIFDKTKNWLYFNCKYFNNYIHLSYSL